MSLWTYTYAHNFVRWYGVHTKETYLIMFLHSFPNDTILVESKFKAFADDKIISTKK